MAGTVHLVLTVLLTLVFIDKVESTFGYLPQICLDHKSKVTPSFDTEEFDGCKHWEHQVSCCTAEQGRYLLENDTAINVIEPACGEFSPECRKYILAVSCFYHCEPMLKHYQHDNRTHAPQNVPICGSYCDDWFDACKDDTTCVEDWLPVLFINPGTDNCLTDGSTCIKFTQMYGNAEGMCNTMLGWNYRYEASNKDCMLMMFDGRNPNLHGDPYGKKGMKNEANNVTVSLLIYLSLLVLTCCLKN